MQQKADGRKTVGVYQQGNDFI
jgi:hypothetical protein